MQRQAIELTKPLENTMNKSINPNIVDPAYVQISRKEAAAILGFSTAELDRRRKADPRCPVGFKERDDRMAPVRFRLSDIYTYSEAIMDGAVSAINSPENPCTNTANHQLPKHHKE